VEITSCEEHSCRLLPTSLWDIILAKTGGIRKENRKILRRVIYLPSSLVSGHSTTAYLITKPPGQKYHFREQPPQLNLEDTCAIHHTPCLHGCQFSRASAVQRPRRPLWSHSSSHFCRRGMPRSSLRCPTTPGRTINVFVVVEARPPGMERRLVVVTRARSSMERCLLGSRVARRRSTLSRA
jgi:hypothetical protein